MDITKRATTKKTNKLDDLGVADNLSMEARVILQNFASEFIEGCFNRQSPILCAWCMVLSYQKAFLSALLKDIRSERPKITEKDHVRLLFMTKWFLEFFLAMRSKEQKSNVGEDKWDFGLVAEVTERSWIIWVLKRMREAVEEKVRRRVCAFNYISLGDIHIQLRKVILTINV